MIVHWYINHLYFVYHPCGDMQHVYLYCERSWGR